MLTSTSLMNTYSLFNPMSATEIINLNDHRTPGARVFTGRPRGEEVRLKSHIDEVEARAEHVTVRIPADTITINPSFLEEWLRFVVRKLGAARFREKFRFETLGRYDISENLDLAIENILRNSNALVR